MKERKPQFRYKEPDMFLLLSDLYNPITRNLFEQHRDEVIRYRDRYEGDEWDDLEGSEIYTDKEGIIVDDEQEDEIWERSGYGYYHDPYDLYGEEFDFINVEDDVYDFFFNLVCMIGKPYLLDFLIEKFKGSEFINIEVGEHRFQIQENKEKVYSSVIISDNALFWIEIIYSRKRKFSIGLHQVDKKKYHILA